MSDNYFGEQKITPRNEAQTKRLRRKKVIKIVKKGAPTALKIAAIAAFATTFAMVFSSLSEANDAFNQKEGKRNTEYYESIQEKMSENENTDENDKLKQESLAEESQITDAIRDQQEKGMGK
jgi:hypothetical protein